MTKVGKYTSTSRLSAESPIVDEWLMKVDSVGNGCSNNGGSRTKTQMTIIISSDKIK